MPGPITDRQIHRTGINATSIRGLANRNPFSRVLYVQSIHNNGGDVGRSGLNSEAPYATVAQAITAARVDDLILVGPGHVETISAAAGWNLAATTKAGVQIVGLGEGDRRPKITVDTVATASVLVAAAGVLIENIHFAVGVDSLVVIISGTGADCTIRNCKITHDASFQAINAISLAATADRWIIEGLIALQAAVGATACIADAGSDGLIVRNCFITGDYSGGCIDNDTAPATDVMIADNVLESTHANDICISVQATATGWIVRNHCRIATDAQVTWITATQDCQLGENYGVNLDSETGKLIGTVSA